MSITPVSSIPVSIDYTGRDYYSLREALIARIQERVPDWTAADPADFGVALVEAFAYLGDVVSYYIDRTANEAFLQTAVQRSSLLNIAQTFGYIPAGYRQASLTLTFSNSSVNLPVSNFFSFFLALRRSSSLLLSYLTLKSSLPSSNFLCVFSEH